MAKQFSTTTHHEQMKRDRAVWKSVGVSNISELTKNQNHTTMDVGRHDLGTAEAMGRNGNLPTKHAGSSMIRYQSNSNTHLTNRSGYSHNIING